MKALIIGNQKRYEKYNPGTLFSNSVEKIYYDMDTPIDQILEKGKDADFLAADAIFPVTEELISKMPDLKIIHSEGVAYNKIDCDAAAKRGIYVCNNKGVNADAVAEQTLLLILGLLKNVIAGDRAVRMGNQIILKEQMMLDGLLELGDCKVGLLGFGDIAKSTARHLIPFGCEVYYHANRRKSEELEKEYHVKWAKMDEIRNICDIISIHIPVTSETTGMIDESFFRQMKKGSLLINTSRGELIDNEALCKALKEGWISGAGLDTVAPEPVRADNPLLLESDEVQNKILFSPHIGGISIGAFKRSHGSIWKAFEAVSKGKIPDHIVNNL